MAERVQETTYRATRGIGDMLLEMNLLTGEQLAQALQGAGQDQRIEDVLIDKRLVAPETVALLLSMQHQVPFENLKKRGVDPRAPELFPEWLCRRYTTVPISITDHAITLAMWDVGNIQAIDELAAFTKRSVEPVLALRRDILEAIDLNYRVSTAIEHQLSQIPGWGLAEEKGGDDADFESLYGIDQAPVVRAIDLLMRQAARDRASDVHMEPQQNLLRIRFRIDGILHEALDLPMSVHSALISRIKIMAGLNIAERRRPQDGQFTFQVEDRDMDVRVATSNTVHGEMAVLRLLDKSFALLTLPELGFLPSSLERYRDMLKSPFGIILVSGPTGAGKTTTLYASVNQLDSVGRNIITIEDPVEYRFENINQMQVNTGAGFTFAGGLRATMRLDPDVILVGEIRDAETAEIAVQAALTGHLVLSSVHANDSVGVLFRLIDLGVEPFLVASATIGIVAQRMARRVCPNCAHLAPVSDEERFAYEEELGEKRELFLQGAGCEFCARTGYLGRTGIYEVMTVTEPIRRLLLNGAGPDDIYKQAIEDGLITLWHDGMLKVQSGATTPAEVFRNVYSIG